MSETAPRGVIDPYARLSGTGCADCDVATLVPGPRVPGAQVPGARVPTDRRDHLR